MLANFKNTFEHITIIIVMFIVKVADEPGSSLTQQTKFMTFVKPMNQTQVHESGTALIQT